MFCFCFGFVNLFSQNLNCFSLYKQKSKTVQIRKTFYKKDTISLIGSKNAISGLSVSGSVKLNDIHSLVRIILIDNKANEYLVFESYSQISENNVFSFNNICEETSLLDSIIPSSLKIIITNAELTINSIEMSTVRIDKNEITHFKEMKKGIKKNQVTFKAKQINANNKRNKKSWAAGVTDFSLQPFSIRKTAFCNEDDYNSQGLEYYESGFFLLDADNESSSASLQESTQISSNYISSFDWRNRHGINWMTPVRHQSTGGSCWAFTPVAVTESMVNLYYNQKLDLDLSEQDVVSCSGAGTNASGGYAGSAIDYIKNTGVVDENCFPFANSDLPCSNKCTTPTEKIKISGKTAVSFVVDSIKRHLIFNGPLSSGFINAHCAHSMPLVGFNIVKQGDTIRHVYNTCGGDSIVGAGNPLIGQTYWIFKNSYGIGSGNNGYLYIVFNSFNDILLNGYLNTPITSLNYSSSDIKCVDLDGDGYYNWGIGPKPASCPACAPNEEDGDDSNPNFGPMDKYGYCRQLTSPFNAPPTIINSNTIWNTNINVCGNLVLQSGTLTINNNSVLSMGNLATITIMSGASLIIDSASILNANIKVLTGSILIMKNNGLIRLRSNGEFYTETGTNIDIPYGSIDK